MHYSSPSGPVDFNPLHHEGGDLLSLLRRPFFLISIHSTTRVETLSLRHLWCGQMISIHSTTRVETRRKRLEDRQKWISIHSTTRVETCWIRCGIR